MMPKSKYHVAALIAGSFSLGASVACGAEAYPTRPVRFVLGPGPSSGTDIMARGIAQKLAERLGQTVLVENRTGAGGTVAVASVVKAAPDGYTILFVSGSLVIHPAVYRKLPYDVVRDLAPIMLIGMVPQVIVVHPSLPARTMRELIALAKSRPGQINYGSGGVGSTGHLAGELLQSMAGVRLVHVPYKGAGPAAVDLIGGQIEMLVTSAVNALQHERSGRVRPLAVTTARRSLAMPDVPTVAEAALPGYELMTWYGLLAPAGTPREAIDRLNRETTAVLKLADVQSRLAADGVEPAPDTPGAVLRLDQVGARAHRKIIREANIQIE